MSFAKKWDATYISKLIAGGGIDKVIEYYKGRYYGDNRDPQDAFKIAELYVKKKEYATAMEWYDKESQLINTSKVNLFNYANTNRLMGEYQKALDGYLMYAALTGDVNKVMDLANQCEKILKSSALSYNYKLENYTYNTAAAETNLAVLRTNPVYVTIKNENNKEEKPSYEIYQVVREFEYFTPPVKAYNNNVPKLIVTGLSFSQDGNTLVFSAIDEKASSKKAKTKTEKIYTADYLGGSFLNVKPFPYNIEGVTLKNPAFNTEGTAIYFSSNQPGGFGGFDIWESERVKDKWTAPKNLGKLLNSAANEISPFIMQDGKDNTLYFSSDRDGGFGGFDIYTAKNTTNVWQDVLMQTAPLNSAGDDVSVIYDDQTRTGYLSSNRTGGKGGFDIYRFTPFNLKLVVNTNDTFSEKLIDYALVQVFDGTEKIVEGVTDETGKAVFQINKEKNYTLKISKDSYRPITLKINSFGKISGDSVIADALLKPDAQFSISKGATNNLSLDNYIVFTGKITDAATNKPAARTKMRMVNYTTQKLREVDVDSSGKFEIKLLLNNNYKIIFENQENKITDELTTFGLERNSVKVRDYLLTGNKFKLTENKVYKPGNVPSDMNIKFPDKTTGAVISSEKHEPITQAKIDSLLKVIAADNPQAAQVNKSVKPKVTAVTPAVVQQVPSQTLTENKIIEKQTIVVGPKDEKTEAPSAEKINTTISEAITESKEKLAENTASLETVVSETKETKEVKPVTVKDNDAPLLAADMVSTKKVKKLKAAEEKKAAEVTEKEQQNAVEPLKEEIIAKVEEVKFQPILKKDAVSEVIPKVTEEPAVVITKEADKLSEAEKINAVSVQVQEPSKPVKPKEAIPVIEEKKIQPVPEVLPDIYFKVQLTSYDQGNIKFPEFESLGKVEEVKAYERYIYRLGNFESLERAKEVLELVRSQGYFVAFILQYNKDKVTGIVK